MFFVEAVMRRFLKANFKKSIVLSYDSEKPCNHAGYRAFLLRQNGDLTIILTTNTPVLADRAGCHSSTSGGSKLSIALRSLA